MFGWRARNGVIVSPPNTVVEAELAHMAAEACGVYRHALGRHLSQLDLSDRVGR